MLIMADIEKVHPITQLQDLLDERGVIAPEQTVAQSLTWGLELGVTKLYGAEVELPAGAIGRLVIRQVEQLPERYLAGLSDEAPDMLAFNERRRSGVLADVQIHSISPNHLLVARKSILRMQNANATSKAEISTGSHFAIGKHVDTGGLLEFQTPDLLTARPLELSEMSYSEPSTVAMVFSALKRRQ